jgi:hypothetical protein
MATLNALRTARKSMSKTVKLSAKMTVKKRPPRIQQRRKSMTSKKLKRAVDAAHRKEQERLYHAKVAAQRQSYADFSTEKRELYVAADQAIEEILNGRDEAVYNLTNENKADLKAIHDDYVL